LNNIAIIKIVTGIKALPINSKEAIIN